MKKSIIITFIFLPIFFISCSESILVEARILNIDSDDQHLKIHFDFIYPYQDASSNVNRIEIYRNDSLICLMESTVKSGISTWVFPSIPNGFVIKESISDNVIPTLLKSQDIRFEFSGGIKYPGFGHWQYQSKYSTTEYRGLFDKKGNQKIKISCSYEPWLGKDIVKIKSTVPINVSEANFTLLQQNGTYLEFDIKHKENPTSTVVLVLEKTIKKNEIIVLDFLIDEKTKYQDSILVPDKSNIGLIGKFTDL